MREVSFRNPHTNVLGNQIKPLFEPFVIVVEHNMKAIRWRLHLTVNHMFNGFFYNALTAKSELNLIMPSKFKYRVESV